MEDHKTITQEIGELKYDTFRSGLQGVKGDILESHPLESARHTANLCKQEINRKTQADIYGYAFTLRTAIERDILSKKFQRPQGAINSSYLGLEAITGDLDCIGFEDYLNDPRESETLRPVDLHHGMEVRLGISKGPVDRSFI